MTSDVIATLRAAIASDAPARAGVEAGPARPPISREARSALQQALRLLAVRGYPRLELRQRLLRKHEPADVDAALDSLAASPFLDDAAWAASHVASRRGRERSEALLRRELASKGVTSEDAAAALANHDDREAALAAARKRVGALARLDTATRTRRLRDYLSRRGFSSAAVRHALEATLEG